jgi:hypothetical protein
MRPARRRIETMAVRFPKIPKVRVRADLRLRDWADMSGQIFVEATSRIQDLLNAPEPFFTFIDEAGIVHLINKNAVVQLTPYD